MNLFQNDVNNNKMVKVSSKDDYTIQYKEKKPQITRQIADLRVLRKQKALFICHCSGNPTPTITWFINDQRVLRGHNRFKIITDSTPQKSVLRISPVYYKDHFSRITCQASNGMGKVFSMATLFVYKSREDAPSGFPLLKSKAAVRVNEKNAPVTLPCSAIGDPRPNIIWIKDSNMVDFNDRRYQLKKSGGLEITHTIEEDGGQYECMATNKHGTVLSNVMKLLIRRNVEQTYLILMKNASYFAPQIVYIPPNQYVRAGSSLTLRCRALGVPKPKVQWRCGQTLLQPNYVPSSFQIANQNRVTESVVVLADLSESIECTCEASNSKEIREKTISIKIQESFASPELVRVTSVTAESARLSWRERNTKSDGFQYYIAIVAVPKNLDSYMVQTSNKTRYIPITSTDFSIIPNKEMTSNIKGLMSYTNYSVWIEARSNRGEVIKTEAIMFTTKELAPSTPPSKIEIAAISNRAVAVSWKPPIKTNGIIKRYYIYYTRYLNKPLSLWKRYQVDSKGTNTGSQTEILSHLDFNTTYYIRISSENRGGKGPISEPIAIQVRAGVFQAPKNLKATPKSSIEILLEWDPFISKSLMTIDKYRLVFYPKDQPYQRSTKQWKFTHSSKSMTVSDLQPNTTYIFKLYVHTKVEAGLDATVECSTLLRTSKFSIKLTALPINSTAILTKWTVLDSVLMKDVRGYTLTCSQYTENTTQQSPWSQNFPFRANMSLQQFQYIVAGLQPSSYYYMTLAASAAYQTSYFRTEVMRTWPPKLEPPLYFNLRLSCDLKCVSLSWKPPKSDQKSIEGYRIRFYRLVEMINRIKRRNLNENESQQYKRVEMVEHNVSSSILSYTTSPLEHYQGFYYEFEVAAFTKLQIGNIASNKILIIEGKPSGYPYGFKFTQPGINNPTEVQFSWSKIPQQALNGQFQFYEMKCEIDSDNNNNYFNNKQNNQINNNKRKDGMLKSYKTKKEEIVVSDLMENVKYMCFVRVCIKSSCGTWSNSLMVKIQEATLPAPTEIRLVRLNPTEAEVTWAWKQEYLIYYSHFLIYYLDENKSKLTTWPTVSTKYIVTKFKLTNLSATGSYMIQIRAVSKRGLKGYPSKTVREISLDKSSWPAKSVSQLSCAPENSYSILLRWRSKLNLTEVSHFRVIFNGKTEFPQPSNYTLKNRYNISLNMLDGNVEKSGRILLIRNTEEQSAPVTLRSNSNTALRLYWTHRIIKLYPNTIYTIYVEPIFRGSSKLIGSPDSVSCSTLEQLPDQIPNSQLFNIIKSKNQIEIQINRPILENGTIDSYYIFISSYFEPKKSIKESFKLPDLTPDYDIMSFSTIQALQNELVDYTSRSDSMYIALNITGQQIFPSNAPLKLKHQVKLGTGRSNGIIHDRLLNISFTYQMKTLACIQKDSKHQCRESEWGPKFSLNSSDLILASKSNPNQPPPLINNSSSGPSNFTTTTVVIVLTILIILGLLAFGIFTLRRRKQTNSKLGVIYNNNNIRFDLL